MGKLRVKLAKLHRTWSIPETIKPSKETQALIIAGIILGILAPFGTSETNSIATRIPYWVLLLLIANLMAGPIEGKLLSILREKEHHFFVLYIAKSITLSVPVFIIVVISNNLELFGIFTHPEDFSFALVQALLDNAQYGFFDYLIQFGQVFFITLLINGADTLLYDKLQKSPSLETVPPAGQLFLNRLPTELGNKLICLSMEDHYVRTHTAQGDALIFMRLSDALEELKDYPGFQTHRSWWVALGAITHVTKEKRRYNVHLNNGMTAPVSQTYEKLLKEKGFI